MDAQDFRSLQEAYIGVYDDDIREKLEFESWVNNLLEEGYDLSDYTWDELYESYFDEATAIASPAPGGRGRKNSYTKKVRISGRYSNVSDAKERMKTPLSKYDTKMQLKKEEYVDEAQYTPPPQIQQPPAEVRNAPKNKLSPVSTVGTGLAAAYLGNEIGKKLLKKKPNVKGVFEKLDIFGIVLEYLITEGYADTQEAAERIMVNMSEEWRESIVEEVLDEAYVDYKKGKLPSGRTPQQAAQGRSELLNARERNRPLGKLDGTYSRQQNQGRRTKEMDKLTASNPVNRAVRRGLGDMLPGGQPSTDRHSNAMDRRNRVADIASAEKKSRDR